MSNEPQSKESRERQIEQMRDQVRRIEKQRLHLKLMREKLDMMKAERDSAKERADFLLEMCRDAQDGAIEAMRQVTALHLALGAIHERLRRGGVDEAAAQAMREEAEKAWRELAKVGKEATSA